MFRLIMIYLKLYFKINTGFKMADNDEEQQDQKKILRDKNNNIEYIRGKLLGTGGFAKCFEVINQDNQQLYAAKVIPKKSINQKRQRYKLLVEIKIHRSLKHKHIVEFIQTFEDRQNVYILLEYCQNYTLKDLVKRRKRVTEHQTRIYIQQIVKALSYIHSHSIIHRDLKLGNILINDLMHTKICDFGLSTRVKHEGELKKTICGTPNYIAPQILQENGHSYEVDIWSIGVIMYTLLFGKPPFEDNTVEQTYQNIKTNRFSYPSSIPVSNRAKDLINKILVTDPSKRISLSQILQHSFMKHREQLPQQLPSYTIAIPPFKIMEIESRQLSQHDTNLQVSEQALNRSQTFPVSSQKSKIQNSQRLEQSSVVDVPIHVKQCFFHNQMLGYLLSNGSIGVYYKQTGANSILQYGCSNYFIFSKQRNNKPLKKIIASPTFDIDFSTDCPYLQNLKNFRSFFITKYGIFKLDQLYKKYSNSHNTSRSKNRVGGQQELIYIKKAISLKSEQILLRLSNSIVQLHFKDLTSLLVDKDEGMSIIYLNEKGRAYEIEYNKCGDKEIKKKTRLFRNLLQKLTEITKDKN